MKHEWGFIEIFLRFLVLPFGAGVYLKLFEIVHFSVSLSVFLVPKFIILKADIWIFCSSFSFISWIWHLICEVKGGYSLLNSLYLC
jgi:hypothetical protein